MDNSEKLHKTVTHIDVGLSERMARLSGECPGVEILCLATDGDSIRDSLTAIQSVGGYPAACNCGACKRIVEYLERGLALSQARKKAGISGKS